MRNYRFLSFVFLLSAGVLPTMPAFADLPRQDSPVSVPSPDELIAEVNSLRISHGQHPLNPHSILMQVAQEQADTLAGTGGSAGHERSNGMSLTEYLIVLGYPLSGDLSQGGYRSENFILGVDTVEQAIQAWLGDEPHTNTMLSPNRSDIGAGIAVDADGVIYYVIDTALQTTSGRPQGVALTMLASVPITQTAAAEWAANLSLPQYVVPVGVSTARPDGDVIHEVRYGQTLWTIAITYNTTIDQIKRLNNLSSDVVIPGWTLLVAKGATQPALPSPTMVPVTLGGTALSSPTPSATTSPTPDEAAELVRSLGQDKTVVVALIVSFAVLAAALVGFGAKREK